MKTFTNRIALLAAGTLVLGATAWGQTVTMKAQIPFAFQASHKVLAAGAYTISEDGHTGTRVATVRSATTRNAVFAMATQLELQAKGSPAMMFLCGQEGCKLAAIRTSGGTVSYGPGVPRNDARNASREEQLALIEVPLRAVNGD